MNRMIRSPLASASLALLGLAALAPNTLHAGPNVGGTLILHYGGNPFGTNECEFLEDPWCIEECRDLPQTCESAITEYEPFGYVMIFVLAAFAPSSSPRLASVSFGVDARTLWEPTIFEWGACPGTEEPTDNWPFPGTGTTVTLAEVGTTELVPVYAFAAYNKYDLPVELSLIPHPTEGAVFRDDSTPPVVDEIADLGRFGFGGEPGYLPCPEAPVPVERMSWGATKGEFQTRSERR